MNKSHETVHAMLVALSIYVKYLQLYNKYHFARCAQEFSVFCVFLQT